MQLWPSRSSYLTEREKCKLLLTTNEMRTNGAMCLESWDAGTGLWGHKRLHSWIIASRRMGRMGRICIESIMQWGLQGDISSLWHETVGFMRKKWKDTRLERSSGWRPQMAFNTVPQSKEQPQRHLLNKMHCAENTNKNCPKIRDYHL